MDKKLWGGRFDEPTDSLMERLNASIDFDKRLYRQDIKASQAHAAMLASQGILSVEEAGRIISGLGKVLDEIEAGQVQWQVGLEDIHTHVEARLKELIGEVAGKLHTGRSRNDQVATDLRLWVVESIAELKRALLNWQRALLTLAETYADVIMPGYTHLQRAQPVLFAHHMLAYVEMAERDKSRLEHCAQRAAVLPLGAAALAGTTYALDPTLVAEELGFGATFNNSLDAVSDRDFAVEFAFCCALIQTHLSRLAEEIILWSTSEFSFVTLSEAFSTGSSIMPQKKNPDAAELIRGKTGRVNGHVVALLTMLKGLPLAYNKDMQEDKEPVFDAFDTVLDCLKVMAPMLRNMLVKPERMRKAVNDGFLNATELADYLASKGMAFRQAHHVAGQAVRLAEAKGCTLEELELSELQALSELIGPEVYSLLTPEQAIARRLSPGGTAGELVMMAIAQAKEKLWRQD